MKETWNNHKYLLLNHENVLLGDIWPRLFAFPFSPSNQTPCDEMYIILHHKCVHNGEG